MHQFLPIHPLLQAMSESCVFYRQIHMNPLTLAYLCAIPGVQAAKILPWAKAVILHFPFFPPL